jgi:hypothetical protein
MNTEDSRSEQAIQPYRNRVPANLDDWTRQIKQKQTINDLVEAVIRALMKSDAAESLADFLSPLWDEEAIEGSLAADNLEAANMVREFARKHGEFADLASKKKATIGKSIRVVMRRYKLGAQERRQIVGGEVVAGNSGD